MPENITLITETKKGTRVKAPATIERADGRIYFMKSPFALKDEIKSMKGSKYHGYLEGDGRKIWSVDDCTRNNFQLEFMMGGNPYANWDKPLQEHLYSRPLYKHQQLMSDTILTYHYTILAAEMGCISGDAVVHCSRAGRGFQITLEELHNKWIKKKNHKRKLGQKSWDSSIPTYVRSMKGNELGLHRLINVIDKGCKNTIKITLKSGKELICTPDHEIYVDKTTCIPAEDLKVGDLVLTNGSWVDKDGYVPKFDTIKSIEDNGNTRVFDLVMDDPYRNFVANGFIVHNCGKTLSAIEAMEQTGIFDWWWVGPKSALASVEREFDKWGLKIQPRIMTYDRLRIDIERWEEAPAPQGVIFDESSRLKSPISKRSKAAQHLADSIRDEWGWNGFVVLMSGTPAPKSPVDWWSQCITGDTWILTSNGPRQVKDITNTIKVKAQDKIEDSTSFVYKGEKQTYLLETVEGYSIKATNDHKFYRDGWCELKDLNIGDKIHLANQSDFDWEGEGTFEDGWLLGFLVGDGNIYEKNGKLYGRIKFYGEKQKLLSLVDTYFPGYNFANKPHKSVQFIYFNNLIRNFNFDKTKNITKKFESTASSKCIKGFIRGLFDSDGHVNYNRLRITFSQVNKERVLTTQRLLTYFGIKSKLQIHKGQSSYINGRELKQSDFIYTLHIINDDAVKFYDRIGFNHENKANTLKNKIDNKHKFPYDIRVTIKNIEPLKIESVYDAEVKNIHCFSANGLLAHNCEICYPGFIREGSAKAFEQRLAIFEKQEFGQGPIWTRVTWKDDENKCELCGKYKEHENHTDDVFGGNTHQFKSSKNEVAYLYERLNGLVLPLAKKDCLDIPDKIYREVVLEPSATIKRVAKALASSAESAIQGLTWLRELSDGFQYREIQKGVVPCPVCEGKGECRQWDEGEKTLQTCSRCDGVGEVPNMVRETKEIKTPKDKAVCNLLEENEDQGRVIFFAGFQGSIDRIVNICHKQQWNVVKVDGRGWKVLPHDETKTKDKPLDYWANMDIDRVAFVAHPTSGGMGLTLTEARMAVFYSNDFNPESRSQAEDRIHRPGIDMNKGATIVDLFHLGTDRKVRDVLVDNRRLETMTLGEMRETI